MRGDTATHRLTALLENTRNRDGGWPYFAGRHSRLEPTCWALLALRSAATSTPLARWQGNHGLLVEDGLPHPNLAFNALAALAMASPHAGQPAMGVDVMRSLMRYKGVQARETAVVRQNGRLQGWPWIDGTFSWVEPTAWCTLAAKKLGHRLPDADARIDEAQQLLRDRACRGGGWNYGNSQVYGTNLHAHVPPTAVAVLAMQDLRGDGAVIGAVDYLRQQAPAEGSTTALALAWIALRAVGAPGLELATALRARLEIALEFGNLAVAALMLYALGRQERGTPPVELMLGAEGVA